MSLIVNFLLKLLKYIPVNIASVVGIAQALVKLIKELTTGVVNIFYPIIPQAKFLSVVMKVRDIVNKLDEWLETLKGFLLKAVGSSSS